jgi:hypothetical protein
MSLLSQFANLLMAVPTALPLPRKAVHFYTGIPHPALGIRLGRNPTNDRIWHLEAA